jgi:hypothetical protein
MAYFGHTSAGNAAKVVLRRDPGGRSLLVGNVAAITVAAILYCLMVIAVLGAVPADALIGYDGTALTPLGEVGGPAVVILGSLFVILAMGLSSLHISLGLYNQVGEWLPSTAGSVAPTPTDSAAARRRRSLIKAAPVVGLLLVLEVLLLTGAGSFTGSLSFLGTITLPLLGGLFPVLLLVAARRRGEYVPSAVIAWIGHPLVVVLVGGLFFVGLIAHAAVIWTAPVERMAALIAAIAFAVVAVWAVRTEAFRPRTVVELRVDDGRPAIAILSLVDRGRAASAPIRGLSTATVVSPSDGRLGPVDGLSDFEVVLPAERSMDLRVWSHRVSRAGDSTVWPAEIDIADADEVLPVPMDGDGRGDAAIDPGTRVIIRPIGDADDRLASARAAGR